MKKAILMSFISLVSVVAVIIAIIVIALETGFERGEQYITTDIANYGKIVGNHKNDLVEESIFSFFPKKIEPNFKNVEYYYSAIDSGACCYEAYLEFTIEDKTEFNDFVSSVVDKEKVIPFFCDDDYKEYTIANGFDFQYEEKSIIDSKDMGYILSSACTDLKKILYSESTQKIVFVSVEMGMDAFAYTSELNYFTDKFNVDIFELMTKCYPCVDYQNVITGRVTKAAYYKDDIQKILNHPNRVIKTQENESTSK